MAKSKKNINTRKYKKNHSRVNNLRRKNNVRNSKKVNRKLTKLRGGAGKQKIILQDFNRPNFSNKLTKCIEFNNMKKENLETCKNNYDDIIKQVLNIQDKELTNKGILDKKSFLNNYLYDKIDTINKLLFSLEFNDCLNTKAVYKDEKTLNICIKNINLLILEKKKKQNKTVQDIIFNKFLNDNLENVKKTIFLGTCKNPQKLFYNSFNLDNVNNEMKPYILDWLQLIEDNLDDIEIRDLEYAFMYNPKEQFSYNIKNMTLYIKKIRIFT